MASHDESTSVVIQSSGARKAVVGNLQTTGILNSQTDIVAEEDEKESDADGSVSKSRHAKRKESEDEMASVSADGKEDESNQSDTSIHRIQDSFQQMRRTGSQNHRGTFRRVASSGALRKSLVNSDNSHILLNSLDDAQKPERKTSKRRFGKLQRQMSSLGPSSKSSARGNDSMAKGKRKLLDSGIMEDSMMELDLEEEVIPRDTVKRCFIEELCTCEILEH